MIKYPDRRIAKGSILYEASEEHRRVIAWEIADIYIEDIVKCSPEVVVWVYDPGFGYEKMSS